MIRIVSCYRLRDIIGVLVPLVRARGSTKGLAQYIPKEMCKHSNVITIKTHNWNTGLGKQ